MNDADSIRLIQAVCRGDAQALGMLLESYRERLVRIVSVRMDRRMSARLDAADVVQEASLEAAQRIGDYAEVADSMPFFVWLRFLTLQKLFELHRRHMVAGKRDVRQEIRQAAPSGMDETSVQLAARLLGHDITPSEAVARMEMQDHLRSALESLEEIDREVLLLRHFEQLTNMEAAKVMQVDPSAASNRHVRALQRLKVAFQSKFSAGYGR